MAGDVDTSLEWCELVPGGALVYYADGAEEILYANRYTLDLFECANFDEFMELTGGTFRGLVHGSDVESTEDSIWGQVDKHDGLDHIYYQARTKSGRLLSLDDYGLLVRRPGERPRFHVFIVEVDRKGAIDWLTGLPDMERFLYLADIEASALVARRQVPALLVFDLLGMRTFNATAGRKEGDQLLRVFAGLLREQFGSELCCRYGGDSFCTIAPVDGLEKRVQAVFDAFSANESGTLPVTAGACELFEGEDLRLVLDRAKYACEQDRNTWSSHLSWFSAELRDQAIMRAYVLEHVDEAIAKGWIRPFYQGLVRTASGAVCGEEALARWIDPHYGFLSPAQFIPTLEDAGLLPKLDLHIVECVLSDMARKREHGVPLVPVSVNVSLRDLAVTDFVPRLAAHADAHGVPHNLLCIEFTESAAATDPDALKTHIRQLHDAGFQVWMDDFGSGFSSLNNLGLFEFDLIKLDMGFLYDRERDKSRVIIDGVIRAAKRMGLHTLAEGVEVREQALLLRDMGCDVLQGFRYFRAQPLDEIITEYGTSGALVREPSEEREYWDAVSSVSITDLGSNGAGQGVSEVSLSELPAGVYELRGGKWWMLRANSALCETLGSIGLRDSDQPIYDPYEPSSALAEDEGFLVAVERCRKSGAWERISGNSHGALGFQFYVSPLARCEAAEAFLITSTPSLLGAALGTYGDVPVGYAVLRVTAPNDEPSAVSAEYVYANEHYLRYGGFRTVDLVGRTITETSAVGGEWLLPYCYRAAILGESVHDVVFSEKAGHWLSFNVAPSPAPDCCIFAFTLADVEQLERQAMKVDKTTSDLIIATAGALNTARGYNEAMNDLLKAMSRAIHPDRIYIYERDERTTSNTFEWCAPGVEPQIATLQDMPTKDFEMWEYLLSRDSVVMIDDVSALADSEPCMYQHLHRQGIERMLAVPLVVGSELIGYLGADNYVLEEQLDTHRLLSTVASFVGARIAHQRMVDELRHLRTHDVLTGALNRFGIDNAIARALEAHPHEPMSLAFVDVDDFRALNDLYGRAVGDKALRLAIDNVRQAAPADAVIGRNGGDEVLLALFGDEAAAVPDILAQITGKLFTYELDGKSYVMSLSAGCVVCSNGDDLERAYTHADEALYAVKHSGTSGWMRWDPSLRKEMPPLTYRYA